MGKNRLEAFSDGVYVLSVVAARADASISIGLALKWLVPDRRIERVMPREEV